MNLWDKTLMVKLNWSIDFLTPWEIDDIYSKNYDVKLCVMKPDIDGFFEEIEIKDRDHFTDYITKLEEKYL